MFRDHAIYYTKSGVPMIYLYSFNPYTGEKVDSIYSYCSTKIYCKYQVVTKHKILWFEWYTIPDKEITMEFNRWDDLKCEIHKFKSNK